MSIRKIIWIAAIPIFISIIISLFWFSNQKFSTKIDDWASFSTWIGLSVSLSATILLGFLTWRIHKNEEKREYDNKIFLESLERPVCEFVPNGKENGIDKWSIQNVGRGAAINLHIGYYGYYENQDNKWKNVFVKAYSLEPNGKLKLRWLHKTECRKLIVYYTGITSTQLYYTLGEGDNSFALASENTNSPSIKTLTEQGMYFKTIQDL